MADEIVGVTIPDLPNAGALTGSEQFETVQDGISVKTTADGIREYVGAVTGITSTDGSIGIDLTDPSAPDLSIGYRSYVALLTQTGTSAPTVTLLQNSTGLTWTASYDDVGNYFLEPDTAPDPDKVAVFCTNASSTGNIVCFWRDDKLNVSSSALGLSTNGVLSNTAVEIKIYS